jgi:hypothetical protein
MKPFHDQTLTWTNPSYFLNKWREKKGNKKKKKKKRVGKVGKVKGNCKTLNHACSDASVLPCRKTAPKHQNLLLFTNGLYNRIHISIRLYE